ncbi:hypothetical protein [Ructibacterium gallinarum]|uniref:Uncharacterized protein n=1 Tax=Ructibacterium gallinarum TaxID=2779355 RepID=A0A9D5R924_9FIRM|nr:hypothetical protein [Ructibacterium gallinarum]MBE5041006.1 hypothetical protein [Ructibacterium gallinarum]
MVWILLFFALGTLFRLGFICCCMLAGREDTILNNPIKDKNDVSSLERSVGYFSIRGFFPLFNVARYGFSRAECQELDILNVPRCLNRRGTSCLSFIWRF